jgi:hypothetical protein
MNIPELLVGGVLHVLDRRTRLWHDFDLPILDTPTLRAMDSVVIAPVMKATGPKAGQLIITITGYAALGLSWVGWLCSGVGSLAVAYRHHHYCMV